jgi:hypothetical protein
VELSTLFGLPAHPLIVHSVVVLVPLVALGAVLVALSPSLRARYGSLVAAGAVLDVLLVPLASGSGEQLEDQVRETALVEQHAEMGEQLLPFVIATAVGLLLLLALRGRLASRLEGTRAAVVNPPWVATLMVVVILLSSVGALVQVARIGHSGAKAAWSDTATQGER